MKQLKKLFLSFLCACMAVATFQPKLTSVYATEDDTAEITSESEEQNEASILGEDESLREEDSKTFLMSDRSYQKVIYSIPVHYMGQRRNVWKLMIF